MTEATVTKLIYDKNLVVLLKKAAFNAGGATAEESQQLIDAGYVYLTNDDRWDIYPKAWDWLVQDFFTHPELVDKLESYRVSYVLPDTSNWIRDRIDKYIADGWIEVKDGVYHTTELGYSIAARQFAWWLQSEKPYSHPVYVDLAYMNGVPENDIESAFIAPMHKHDQYWRRLHKQIRENMTDAERAALDIPVKRKKSMKLPDWYSDLMAESLRLADSL